MDQEMEDQWVTIQNSGGSMITDCHASNNNML